MGGCRGRTSDGWAQSPQPEVRAAASLEGGHWLPTAVPRSGLLGPGADRSWTWRPWAPSPPADGERKQHGQAGTEPAFPARGCSQGPVGVRGDSRAQQWAAAVGNPALVVPEGGARPLRTAPGVGLRVVTQHELATPPRCAHWAQVLGRLVDPSRRTPPHSSAVLCPQGGLSE